MTGPAKPYLDAEYLPGRSGHAGRAGVEPHHYVTTDPYRGCGRCGFGPGALVHNTFEVERFERAKRQEAIAERLREAVDL